MLLISAQSTIRHLALLCHSSLSNWLHIASATSSTDREGAIRRNDWSSSGSGAILIPAGSQSEEIRRSSYSPLVATAFSKVRRVEGFIRLGSEMGRNEEEEVEDEGWGGGEVIEEEEVKGVGEMTGEDNEDDDIEEGEEKDDEE